MSKLLLIIKAETFHEVKEAAKQRGIHITDICVTDKHEFRFRARTDGRNALQVQKWFLETGEKDVIPNYGYPIGSLLFYSQQAD